ncbi:hypothetical protein GWI33_002211, partial [Rhynchophorus ferrugineus]
MNAVKPRRISAVISPDLH